jgi:phytoene dehydrogenase-like protein
MTTPRVVVVGAGFGGIATGVKLKQAGIDSFTIYESSLGVGGTWWDNTYPGAEVDVGSHLYCFSFKPHHWTRSHARQPELQKYLEPNFFMLYGPGANGGEIVVMLESQAEYAVRAVRRLIRRRATTVEVRPRFEAAWNRWLDRRIEGTSWTMTNNYFKAPSGKVVTQWPYGNLPYRLLTKLLGPISETTRR